MFIKVKGIHLQCTNILVNFDVTSLSTKVPINEALEELYRRLGMVDKDVTLVDLARMKPTHIDRHLNAASHYCPAQKQGVINTLSRHHLWFKKERKE
ncbi:hypothetical protein NQ315_011414 [Exocentrus adspersus]|uniref:Uncharacterized protein n=1 Tax=Exocentrus adspersus TaxID=1586481 RepID=A0AAV8VKZ5_9CUCU|nr:hypothetical protein NQ315_011414 [Exocentrus adspersus]